MINKEIAISQIKQQIEKSEKCAEKAYAIGNMSMHSYFLNKANDARNALQGWVK